MGAYKNLSVLTEEEWNQLNSDLSYLPTTRANFINEYSDLKRENKELRLAIDCIENKFLNNGTIWIQTYSEEETLLSRGTSGILGVFLYEKIDYLSVDYIFDKKTKMLKTPGNNERKIVLYYTDEEGM